MSTFFVGDVHGCSGELESLLDLVADEGVERIVLLGDLFTKGPDRNGVWALIQERALESVLGNHDDRVLKRWARGEEVDLPLEAILWLRKRPLSLQGVAADGRPWAAVHAGIHPRKGVVGTSRDRALVMRRFPNDEPSSPFWWKLWAGPPLVLYGHDAVRGLKDRRPHSLGLDTGCVYGGRLSGYLLDQDRVVSVPAERAWQPIKRARPV